MPRHHKHSVILHLSRPMRILIKRVLLAVFLLLCIVLLALNRSNAPFAVAFRAGTADITSPLVSLLYAPIDYAIRAKRGIRNYFFVYDKNHELREENRHLRRQLTLLTEADLENRRLRKLLNFTREHNFSYLSARVVGDNSGPYIRSVLINAGKNLSVKDGQAVISDTGLVGRVIEVGANSARVLLVTDINSRIPVISAESRERSILVGNNTEFPEMKYLPSDTRLREGEALLTSGDGDLFPPGMPVGTVYKLDKNTFRVKPLVKWNRVEYVSVLKYEAPVDADMDDGTDQEMIPPTRNNEGE